MTKPIQIFSQECIPGGKNKTGPIFRVKLFKWQVALAIEYISGLADSVCNVLFCSDLKHLYFNFIDMDVDNQNTYSRVHEPCILYLLNFIVFLGP